MTYPTPMPMRVMLDFVEGADQAVGLSRVVTHHRATPGVPDHVANVGLDFRWSGEGGGLQALCLLLVSVSVAQGQERIQGNDARALLNSLREAAKSAPRVKWPDLILGGGRSVREILVVDPQGDSVWLDQRELPASEIVVHWNGCVLTQTAKEECIRQLVHLSQALSQDPDIQGAEGRRGSVQARLENRLAARFEVPGWAPRFLVAPAVTGSGISIPAARAADFLIVELQRLLNRKEFVSCAVSGGVAQLAMVDVIEDRKVMWKELGHRITFTALNQMGWPDNRIEQSAEAVAQRLARITGSNRLALVPRTSTCSRQERTYANHLDEVDLFLISGGALVGSFVSQFLRQCEVPTPAGMVGDLAGHVINREGDPIEDERVVRTLAGFRCHPSLAELRRYAVDPHRKVVLLLGELSHGQPVPAGHGAGSIASETSKVPLARACLAARLVDTVILPEPLARELLRAGHHAHH